MTDPAVFVAFAEELADAARIAVLAVAESDWAIENKKEGEGYDPVTRADRAVEQAMRDLIAGRWPDHGIQGEEFGETVGGGRFAWSLDPIDGTRAFICGLPSWTVLIALFEEGRPVLGVIDAPRLDERFIGHGDTAILAGPSGRAPMRTSGCRTLAGARLSTTDPYLFDAYGKAGFDRLRTRARLTRYGLDGYGYGCVAAGRLDLVVESGLAPHDLNALVPVIRAAGGAFANWQGHDDFSRGDIIAAATPELLDEAVSLLSIRSPE